MARQPPKLFSGALTTDQDGAVAFSPAKLWLLGGTMKVTTNSLDVGAVPQLEAAFTSHTAGTSIGAELVPLHQLLVKPTVAGVHGTLTIFGVVVDDEGDFISFAYGGGTR